ncbi:MAG: ABC transporter substrate-binding protein [Clostridia bacterium]
MKKTICLVLALVLLVSIFTLFGCTKRDYNTIRLNEVTHSIFYAPQYLAMALGYFADDGLTIELANGSGADKVMTAIVTDEADIGLLGTEAGIYVYLQGRKDYPKVVGQLTKRDGSFLVSRINEPDFDFTGLTGKSVLMGRKGGMPAMILQYILNNHGYHDGNNITMNYEYAFGVLAPTFIGGTGDYVPLFEPVASKVQSEKNGYIVSALGSESGTIPYTVYMASQTYLREHGDKVESFLRAVQKGTQYLFAHTSAEVAPLLAPYFEGTSVELIKSALDNYKANDVWKTNPAMDEADFVRIQDIMENAGELKARVPFDVLVDNSIANKVTK